MTLHTSRCYKLSAAMIFMVFSSAAIANSYECRNAIDRYNFVLDDVSSAMRRYTSCVADSRGHDDCYSEFRRLKSAQDDFESAVSEFKSECE